MTKKVLYINSIYDLENALNEFRDINTNAYPDFELYCVDMLNRQYLLIIK